MAFGDTYDLNAEGQYTFDDQQRIVPPRPVPRPTPAPAAPSDEEKVRAAKEWMARYLKSPMFAQRMAQTVKDEGWDKRNAANYSQILQGNLQDVQGDFLIPCTEWRRERTTQGGLGIMTKQLLLLVLRLRKATLQLMS